jgi:hypothetical protein
MTSKDIQSRLKAEIDTLANLEHERWSHWQKYMHDKGERQSDGSIVIPAELVAQWDRQIETPFAELSDDEKDSDREQVRKYIPTVARILSDG